MITNKEKDIYKRQIEQKYNRKIKEITFEEDGEYVNCDFTFEKLPFERIRRITGYLVGSLDSWNDAKQSEEKDRVKHDTKKEGL